MPARPIEHGTKVPEIRKGDTVVVLAGRDAGKRGKVEHVVRRDPSPTPVRSGYRRTSLKGGVFVVVDGINIKLAKCGGPREALRMIHSARTHNLLVMMGCMIETSVGITAAAHLAPLLDYADLDGAALLADDPYRGASIDGGRISIPTAPGLGVTHA